MTFESWQEEERNALIKFRSWWMEQHEQCPEHFPLNMEAGDWDEQYRLWSSTQ